LSPIAEIKTFGALPPLPTHYRELVIRHRGMARNMKKLKINIEMCFEEKGY
jgi:hypothetical protein